MAYEITTLVLTDASAISRWIIDRMEEGKAAVTIPQELNDRCDRFLAQLAEGGSFPFAHVTRESLRRMRMQPTFADGVRRSEDILNFLGSVGHRIERARTSIVLNDHDLAECAARSWSDRGTFINIFRQNGSRILASSLAASEHFGVRFELQLKSRHDCYALTAMRAFG